MARREEKILTNGELRIMSVLWEGGAMSAQDVAARLRRPRVSRSSVMTLLAVLERKGYVRHTKSERTYIFSATLDARRARRSALGNVLSKFFGDRVDVLVASLVDDRPLNADEIRAVRRIIDQAKPSGKPSKR